MNKQVLISDNTRFCKCGCGEIISRQCPTGYRTNHFWRDRDKFASQIKVRIEKIRAKALGRNVSEATKEKQRKIWEEKKPINFEYFKKPNRRNAYVLGYLFADGSLQKAKNNGQPRLGLYSTDKELIDKIRVEFGVENRKIRFKIRAKNSKRKNAYSFRIRSYHFLKPLVSMGMLLGKKFNRIFVPKVIAKDKSLFFSFFRGYFDGDGTINYYLPGKVHNHRYPCVRIYSASFKFLKNLKAALLHFGFSAPSIKIKKGSRCFVLTLREKINVYNLYKALYYKADTLYLSRKKQRFDEFFKAYGWKTYDENCGKRRTKESL